MVGAAGGGGGGASAATAAAVTSFGSRLTKTRFLRTSTCTVRYLPVASVLRISLVCLRVSVILFFASAEPWVLRRCSSRRDLSLSESESSGARLSTPAARSCSSSTEGGTLSSLANWATLVWATYAASLLSVNQWARAAMMSFLARSSSSFVSSASSSTARSARS